MKKILTLMALVAGAGAAFSQGTVNFNNNVFNPLPSNPDHSVYADTASAANLLKGTQYSAELYVGANASSLQPLTASISKFRVTTTTNPGTWSGKGALALGMGGVGVPVTLDIVVWDTTMYASAAAAKAAGPGAIGTGDSGAFQYTQLLSVPAALADTYMVGMPAIIVTTVPEPSAIALSVMGVAGLMLIRRRK